VAWLGSICLGTAAIGLIWTGLTFYLEIERTNIKDGVIQDSNNLARSFEEHLVQLIQDVDRTLIVLRAEYERDPAGFDIDNWSKTNDKLVGAPTTKFGIIGPDGFVKASSVGPPANPLYLGDRNYFQAQVDLSRDQLFISRPTVDRRTGKLAVFVGRTIRDPHGSFAGVVEASLDPEYFARLYNSIAIGRHYVRVVGFDGIIRTASGAVGDPHAQDLGDDELSQHQRAAADGWYFSSGPERSRWLVVYRSSKELGLVISVGRSVDEMFADADAHRHAYDLAAIALTCLIVIVTWLSGRGHRKLREATRALRAHNLLLDAAANNMVHGLCMFDAELRLVLSNPRFLEIYSLPAEGVKRGCTLRHIIDLRIAAGSFVHQDPNQYVETLVRQLKAGKPITMIQELDNGRVVEVEVSPLSNGGWVATQKDVTERHRAERELEETRTFLHTVIAHVPVTIAVKDARDFRYVLINRTGENFFGRPKEQIVGRTAYGVFPRDVADAITARDHELIKSGRQDFYDDHPIHSPTNGTSAVITKRTIVRDTFGKPRYLIGVIEDISQARIAHMARHDGLTDLANRLLFMERIDEALARLRDKGQGFSIFLLDLDHFKAVNDSLGHPIGDALLKAMAQRLKSCVGETDIVARLGGDEFAVLQCSSTDRREGAVQLAERVLQITAAPYDLDEHQVSIGTSIGITLAPEDGTDADQLLKSADLALYKAKFTGRNGFRFFESQMQAEADARRALELDLRGALLHRQLELHYQTVIDIATGQTSGVEALVRWRHPQRGIISAQSFIPLAEETGLIVPLGDWALRQACRDAQSLDAPTDIKVAVNLSPVQFGRGNLVDTVSDALRQSGLSPHRLQLEITESVLLQNNAENLTRLHQLKALGVSIVLDDFGTGYSSLSYLRMFPFDRIKIDQSFVNNLTNRRDCATIVSAVINLGRDLHIATTAEGVDTQEQLAWLRTAGCNAAQGFLFSHPVPITDLALGAPRRRSRASEGATAA